MDHQTRRELALLVGLLVVVLAAVAVPIPSALPVLERFEPALMVVLGFYFGRNTGK